MGSLTPCHFPLIGHVLDGVQGCPTASVNWGAWAGAGMAARAGVGRMERLGFGLINPSAGVAALGRLLLATASGQACSSVVASVFLWDRWEFIYLVLILSHKWV